MDLQGDIQEALQTEGPTAIVTTGDDGPHLVGTWNSYIEILDADRLAYPAGGMETTEENVEAGSDLQLLVASHDVEGLHSAGAGFRLQGRATFHYDGEVYETMASRFSWARAGVEVRVDEIEQQI